MIIVFLFLPVFSFASGSPVLFFTDDLVFNYFFTIWVYFLFILFPIVAAISLFRF